MASRLRCCTLDGTGLFESFQSHKTCYQELASLSYLRHAPLFLGQQSLSIMMRGFPDAPTPKESPHQVLLRDTPLLGLLDEKQRTPKTFPSTVEHQWSLDSLLSPVRSKSTDQ
ncbi:hypothetical protein N7468_006320 [Penicillium chermesinum]|uniref:Uncharacterized protein n=1 Tax=Penicillium chermesinum TaxID=63820 RepID=A0A9W9TL10_9EURO|nr:uncharacterized protein N7468_006320 [Penicillium chermesinum]KAJ5225095.1 hypothetical protein N7468_006320 [Penicillium chermesinum]